MNVAAYCAIRQMRREREARAAAIGAPVIVIVPPLIPEEHEAWVAISVPLIEPRPQRKCSPYEKILMRCFLIVLGIMLTVLFMALKGPLYAKILCACISWALPIGIIKITFEPDDEEDTT